MRLVLVVRETDMLLCIVEKDGLGDLRIPFVTDLAAASSAVPAGYCIGSSFIYAGNFARFWSSSQLESSSNGAYSRSLYYGNAYVYRYDGVKNNGFSVRCLRD